MIVTTANEVSGKAIEGYLGVVRGIVVRSPHIGQQLRGAFKSLVGGNIGSYEEVCDAARQQSFDLMVEHAQKLGADAIVAMRYDATEFSAGVTEVLAYGTAVKFG